MTGERKIKKQIETQTKYPGGKRSNKKNLNTIGDLAVAWHSLTAAHTQKKVYPNRAQRWGRIASIRIQPRVVLPIESPVRHFDWAPTIRI